jgi:hypothetical protein
MDTLLGKVGVLLAGEGPEDRQKGACSVAALASAFAAGPWALL